MHEVQRDGVLVVVELLRERIGQAREAAHRHTHGQVLSFNVAGRGVGLVWLTGDYVDFRTDDLRRAIAALSLGCITINLDKHCIVDVRAERAFNRFEVGAMAVSRELDAVSKAIAQIGDELSGGESITATYGIGGDQLGICADGGPGPNIAHVAIGFAIFRDVLLLGPDKGPDFVALDALAGQIADGLAVVDGAGRANVYKELGHRVDRAISNAGDSAEAHAFNEEAEDLCAFGEGHAVHVEHYACALMQNQYIGIGCE